MPHVDIKCFGVVILGNLVYSFIPLGSPDID